MIKYILSTFFILITLAVSAQKKSIVHLIESKSSELIKLNGRNVIKVYKGVFQQDYSIMRSDSAYFYAEDNAFDAFSNVNITQGDTLNIYSDKLNYNGNTKVAILTDNVKMIDKDAVLTTNYLTYNTATRIGTYTGGGKLINKDNTLTSKNGYYFAFSRDSYFRYNVVLITPDALIKTDTLRYNSGSRIAYFYGPTNIYDTKDKKDTLYTENGLYNTVTEQAFFGKKNLYKQGTKTLTGDSLFYDKINGYGRAVKRVTFHDREQNITLKGDLATYYKKGERTVVTQDPYVIIVTEEKDTTKTDTVHIQPGVKQADPTAVKASATVKMANALAVKPPAGTAPVKSLQLPAAKDIDSLTKVGQGALNANKTAAANVVKKADALAVKPRPGGIPVKPGTVPLQVITDSVAKTRAENLTADARSVKGKTPAKGAGLSAFPMGDTVAKIKPPGKKVKRDSIYISADTLETQILTYKDLKIMQEQQRLLSIRDTTTKAKKLSAAEQKKADKFLTLNAPKWINDTLHLYRNFFGKPKPVPAASAQGKNKLKDDAGAFGTLNNNQPASKNPDAEEVDDPIFFTPPVTLSDTARVRIIKAYHSAKLFKSDLQAKADSMFYSYSDSTLRCFVNPLIWTQGSQLSGDTITMQMKNKKLDNLNLFPSSFIVNIEKGDSTNFNQIAGKKMKGFFKSDKLDRMYIVGNAESIYFSRDSLKKVDGMQRSLSSKMRIYFKNGSASNIFFISKPEHRYGPLAKFTEDERILKGFIWKPKERPVSKESIIPSYNKKRARAQAAADKKIADANKLKSAKPGDKAKTDSLQNKLPATDSTKTSGSKAGEAKTPALKAPVVKAKTDSVNTGQAPVIKAPAVKPGQDSTTKGSPVPVTKAAADTVKRKTPGFIKAKKDTTATRP
ncbi:OstA-like protein [Mucilaginibacter terrigena]|uniref:OstA-like protein n=1 Tax=Mucilaginibacter terrigena TaxID=2492395 RepID=UPI0013969913|nr:OstA-like protein [Mucilaginibacter terrigena]